MRVLRGARVVGFSLPYQVGAVWNTGGTRFEAFDVADNLVSCRPNVRSTEDGSSEA